MSKFQFVLDIMMYLAIRTCSNRISSIGMVICEMLSMTPRPRLIGSPTRQLLRRYESLIVLHNTPHDKASS